jgi:enoyl-CoA hydratase/carnithine racemase
MQDSADHQQHGSLLIERHRVGDTVGALAVVSLNRPDELNPLDWDTVRSLEAVFDSLACDSSVRVVAVTGAGRAFSAGGDMKKYQLLQRHPVEFPQFLADFHRLLLKVASYPKPYIALLNGVAVAGGIELVLACDFTIAARAATIGDAHLPFGQMGGGGVLTLLPRCVGPTRARELIFTGRLLAADEAREWGLVSKVVDDGALLEAALEFTNGICKKSALAVGNAKRTLNAGLFEGTGVDASMRLEREVTARYCLTSNDAREGLEAFSNKRRPQFTGT